MLLRPNKPPGYVLFFYGLSIHNNIFIKIEELLGVLFTSEVILELTGESHSPDGRNNVGSSFRLSANLYPLIFQVASLNTRIKKA